MSKRWAYDLWIAQAHPWTPWTKPALLDRLDETTRSEENTWLSATKARIASIDTSWLPERAGAILDLPGEDAVLLALALARNGLRPILAINASSSLTGAEAIDTLGVRRLLLAAQDLPEAFPSGAAVAPAFILDARRSGDGRSPTPGEFDNRWLLFPSDLPSAGELRATGVDRIVVVQNGNDCSPDLAAILRAYAAANVPLTLRDVRHGTSSPLTLPAMPWLRDLASRAARRFAFRRRSDGSYGRWVPLPPAPSHG